MITRSSWIAGSCWKVKVMAVWIGGRAVEQRAGGQAAGGQAFGPAAKGRHRYHKLSFSKPGAGWVRLVGCEVQVQVQVQVVNGAGA